MAVCQDVISLHAKAGSMLLACPLTEDGTGRSPDRCRKKCDGGGRQSLCYNQNTKTFIECEYTQLSVERSLCLPGTTGSGV